ncbi:MAG: TetR/AcrR family transcriptional regulator [bacterium]
MAIIVNHEARRHEILRKSLRLFAEAGYTDVTFQSIADRCGLARTALYKYFHHKRQIFDGAVTVATNDLVGKYRDILARPGPYRDKLEAVIAEVFKILFSQRDLLLVIVEYTLSVKRSGKSLRWVVTRHTRGLKAALCYLLLKGVRAGEFEAMDVRATTELLYALMEATVMRLTLTDDADMQKQMSMVRQVLDDLPRPHTTRKP